MTRCDSSVLPDTAPAGSLDLHEGFSDATAPTRCDRWPKALRLKGSNGALVPGRCRSTRLCDYCSRLEAVEISEVLALDAMKGDAPAVYAVLTTSSTSLDPSDFYESRRQVIRALRRRFPDVRYCCITEFTTGRAGSSGGRRRVHFNLLLKGIPAEAVADACAIVERVWCEREDAEPWAQYVGAVAHEGGLMRYLALHFLKESQRPPASWKGHRVTRSRDYLTLPSWKARAEAKAALRLKRELWRAAELGLDAGEALTLAEAAMHAAEQVRWQLVTLEVTSAGELTGMRPTMGGAMPGPARAPRLTMGELSPDLFRGIPQMGEKLLEPIAHVRRFRYKSGYQSNAERDSAERELGDVTAPLF